MTTIAGLVDGGRVLLAADAQLTDDNWQQHQLGDKLWRWGDIIVGASGLCRPINVIKQIPPHKFGPAHSDPERFMYLEFPRIVREFTKPYNIKLKDVEMVVGIDNLLFRVDDGTDALLFHDYVAIGAGGQYATGSLWTTADFGYLPEDRLHTAVEAAKHHDAMTGGDVEVITTDD